MTLGLLHQAGLSLFLLFTSTWFILSTPSCERLYQQTCSVGQWACEYIASFILTRGKMWHPRRREILCDQFLKGSGQHLPCLLAPLWGHGPGWEGQRASQLSTHFYVESFPSTFCVSGNDIVTLEFTMKL